MKKDLSDSPVEALSAVLKGRVGRSSEDRRRETHANLFGVTVRSGCEGDTLEASVSITGISGKLQGDTVTMTVTYSGKYYRQGWMVPCVQVPREAHGLEERTVTGTYTFSVTGKAFQRPTVTWGTGSGFGEVADPGHDSNVFAIRAVQNAVGTAF